MRKEFNKLANVLERYDLTEYGDELDIALKNLKDKIDELEKRIECVKRTNVDSHEILFTNQVKLEESIGYDNVEILQRSVTDINIAMDLNDKEPIENDWYGLFIEEKKEKSDENFIPLKDEIDRYKVVEEIISKLKMIDVDGETMEYILNKVGMSEQMHSQLSKKFTLYDM